MAADPEISPEDSLRLNVMLAQKPDAVRIDESRLIVYALTGKGEALVELNPNCARETYLRRVKAVLSAQVTGSPGGYPVFLKRWARMGQTRDTSLEQLLLLGDSEAIVAVAHAPGLTEALAKRAWWAMPDADNARVMLNNGRVAKSAIGRELAAFLLEFLPFEEEAGNMLESVRLVLQPGLIGEDEKHKLWHRAQSKPNMLVGFLHALPDALPGAAPAHPGFDACLQSFEASTGEEDPVLATLLRVFSPRGQLFVQTCELALARVSDQDVAVSLFEAIAEYFRRTRFTDGGYRDVGQLEAAVAGFEWNRQPGLEGYVRSILFLSSISVELLNPIFARTDAIGSGMRRKIRPLTERIFHHLSVLRSA
jgi:hypothetical protein